MRDPTSWLPLAMVVEPNGPSFWQPLHGGGTKPLNPLRRSWSRPIRRFYVKFMVRSWRVTSLRFNPSISSLRRDTFRYSLMRILQDWTKIRNTHRQFPLSCNNLLKHGFEMRYLWIFHTVLLFSMIPVSFVFLSLDLSGRCQKSWPGQPRSRGGRAVVFGEKMCLSRDGVSRKRHIRFVSCYSSSSSICCQEFSLSETEGDFQI